MDIVPVPERGTLCGLEASESVYTTNADLLPPALGVNVIVVVQVPAFAIVPVHVLPVIAKSPEFVPVKATEVITSPTPVLFVSVITCPAEVVLTVWLPKERLDGARPTPPLNI